MLLPLLSLACTQGGDPPTTVPTPIFVTLAGHIEDDLDYATKCAYWDDRRGKLLAFAGYVATTEATFNLQASYEWFRGTLDCETAAMRATTDGMNIIDYLVAEYAWQIDIHQEGASIADATSGNNFADIRYLGGQVTSHMTETTGFQWDNPTQYTVLQAGEKGLLHPTFTWKPEILVGGVSIDHTNGDFSRDMTSLGVWIPSGFSETDFHVHDRSNDARMVYVGSGPNQFCADWAPKPDCHYQTTGDFVAVLADHIARGVVPADEIYTTTFFIPQRVMFDAAEHSKVQATLDQLAPLVQSGQVEYATFTEVVDRWRSDYDGRPNIITYDQIADAGRTCVTP